MSDKHNKDHEEHHILPVSLYVKVFIGLIILTGLTVLTSMFDFGIMNIVIAMLIALIKSCLVVFFFMQLKFDEIGNKVTFLSAFVFLSVFILLTSSDLFFRKNPEPVKVTESANQGETDQNILRMATPALVAKGKAIFQVQCVSCHGVDGYGDGPAAAALNPKPRNYHTGVWRFGGSPTRIFHTITEGSPGTGMASYSNLSVEDRYALAHYVRTFNEHNPPDTAADLEAAGLTGNKKAVVAEVKPIPIEMAMEKIETPDQVMIPMGESAMHPDSQGAKIYRQKCVTCHGMNGIGAQVPMNEGQFPRVAPITKSWTGLQADWVDSQGAFISLVSNHFPGTSLASVADLTKDEWSQIYSYAKELTQAH